MKYIVAEELNQQAEPGRLSPANKKEGNTMKAYQSASQITSMICQRESEGNMKRFEVGHSYWAFDSGLGRITVLKRTAHYIFVRSEYGTEWRMKIRECEGKNGDRFEIVFDSAVGRKWVEALTYYSTFEA